MGIEATGAMQWFSELLEELGIECRVGQPAKIRAAEIRKQKHDRRAAEVILDLLLRKDCFPDIWIPSSEQRDPRTLLRDRDRWVKMRTRLRHTLQAIALNNVLREGRVVDCGGATARKLGIRLWIMLRDEIDYEVFCGRGKLPQKGKVQAGMPVTTVVLHEQCPSL